MTAHLYHPDTHENGLADDCPRCDQHADHPFEGLDDRMVASLIARVTDDLPARSNNEAVAMGRVREAINLSKRIAEVSA